MKKIYFVIFFLSLSAYICKAQGGGPTLENLKIAYITRELNLNPNESQMFWPVYNSYWSEVVQARNRFRNDQIAFEEILVNVRKKYRPEFKRILIYDNRVNAVWIVDQRWRETLRMELQNRQRLRRPGP